ncbi:MAG: PTS sugar transporter subunit IIB [Clostridiaceae bacterium]
MNKKKVILIACGAGIATSTVVCERVERLVKEHKLNASVVQCKIAEVASKQGDADLIVSTTILPTKYNIPALKGTPYITGIGADKLDAEIVSFIKGE